MSLFCRGKLIWIKPFVFVDVVYIGTIHPQHYNTGKLFINSRKNVLIEKPLGMNLRQVQELITAAQENNVFLMEVTNPCYLEFYIKGVCYMSQFGSCRQSGHGFSLLTLKWGDSWNKEMLEMFRWWGRSSGFQYRTSLACLRTNWEEVDWWIWASTPCSLPSWFLMGRNPSPSTLVATA